MTAVREGAAGPPVRERPAGPLLLGVRHHGPGSARAVDAVLEAYEPRVVLIEGPPEGDAVVGLAADEAMVPPVALLAHAVNEPGKAAFWPLAEFSPEWVAIRWAVRRGVPVRFIDLPASHTLAMSDGPEEAPGEGAEKPPGEPQPESREEGEKTVPGGTDGGGAAGDIEPAPGRERVDEVRLDPLAALAEAAGYDDPERWWEDAVEHRGGERGTRPADPYEPFAALGEAMAELRAVHGEGGHERDLLREAHMRLRLREARKEFGDAATAVVCGAWHVPALGESTTVTADRQALKGLPKVKTEITWVPWTHRRLARRSGYGAGIASPGWYGHLFSAPDRPVARWMTKVAGLLRAQDHSVSSAHLIEAVRLAETLAAMRGRPLAGLTETTDAIRAVLCEGSDVPLELILDQLVVGDVLGEVPEGAPAVPLQRDVARQQRAVRLKPAAAERELDLDLRKETDAARSRLLHRLRLLGIGWGEPARSRSGSTGTFRESWRLRWEPELSVRVAEAGIWGTTVYEAATAKARSQATEAGGTTLADVTALAELCLLAQLPDALPVVMRVLADRAALESDVGHLARALPALVRTLRYGDVRGTDAGALAEVAGGMAERVCVGLPPACAGLDGEGARDMRGHLDAAHQAVNLLARDEPDASADGPDASADAPDGPGTGSLPGGEGRAAAGLLGRWRAVLRTLAERDRIPGLLRGRCARLLLDDGELADDEAERLMSLVLSPGTPPAEAAAWIEGVLAGGGMLLVHDERLLALIDRWLTGVPGDAFTDVLPLLRRTFAEYETGVRRTLGELVRRGPVGDGDRQGAGPAESLTGFGAGLDTGRADAVRPTVRLLIGLSRLSGDSPTRKSDRTRKSDPTGESDPAHESAETEGEVARV
ncbi:DUF5682 family protein [Streptomyces sp. B15]|uniref:DUF5682 family protein n=1 Tax=Streptomyces sp. B15 TaxID=1537797 RepID=UPI001FFC3E5A|nr:DUF5682 family protein [Streptomyces sp. B15]